MIAKLDQELQAYDADVGNKLQAFQANERGELTVKDIESALKVIKHAPDEEKIKQIVKKLDVDGDGLVLLSHIVELADLVEQEEGTGVLVEGKKPQGKRAEPEKEKKLKKEDVLQDD
jgi:LETM1 and EF-hand domain-containing protein 1